MKDKIILITGATSGIGFQTALALAKMGAQIIVTGRNKTSAEESVANIKSASGNSCVDFLLADLTKQAEIRALVETFKQKYSRLDVLINNAGLVEPIRRLTEDGVEAIFSVNTVAPFLLTHLLLDSLKASPSPRVVTVTGGDVVPIDLENLQAEKSFLSLNTYSQAKVCMMALMVEFAQREKNVAVNVCFPGGASTNMTTSIQPEMAPTILKLIWPLFKWMTRPDNGKSAAKASRSSVYLASSEDVEGMSGKYFNTNCKIVEFPTFVMDTTTRGKVWEAVVHVSNFVG
ncbi:MAG: SDR family NAD(P)-dependent oxidoreductase [Chloroflexi bacterium]|nr:SDR family NAD(P)-dependent oxidoreductase [Chloroflexota bacterium]